MPEILQVLIEDGAYQQADYNHFSTCQSELCLGSNFDPLSKKVFASNYNSGMTLKKEKTKAFGGVLQ
jgi:hypothetical protein